MEYWNRVCDSFVKSTACKMSMIFSLVNCCWSQTEATQVGRSYFLSTFDEAKIDVSCNCFYLRGPTALTLFFTLNSSEDSSDNYLQKKNMLWLSVQIYMNSSLFKSLYIHQPLSCIQYNHTYKNYIIFQSLLRYRCFQL